MIPDIKDVQPKVMTIACIGQLIKRGISVDHSPVMDYTSNPKSNNPHYSLQECHSRSKISRIGRLLVE